MSMYDVSMFDASMYMMMWCEYVYINNTQDIPAPKELKNQIGLNLSLKFIRKAFRKLTMYEIPWNINDDDELKKES